MCFMLPILCDLCASARVPLLACPAVQTLQAALTAGQASSGIPHSLHILISSCPVYEWNHRNTTISLASPSTQATISQVHIWSFGWIVSD